MVRTKIVTHQSGESSHFLFFLFFFIRGREKKIFPFLIIQQNPDWNTLKYCCCKNAGQDPYYSPGKGRGARYWANGFKRATSPNGTQARRFSQKMTGTDEHKLNPKSTLVILFLETWEYLNPPASPTKFRMLIRKGEAPPSTPFPKPVKILGV